MADEIDALLAHARQLEEDNALLRSMQSPRGDDVGLQAENAMLRRQLRSVRDEPQTSAPHTGDAPRPQTLDEFNALPSGQREAAARRMSRRQRDELLGRTDGEHGRECYL